MKTNIHFWKYLTQFFLEWEISQTNIVEKIKTHIVFKNFFFKSCLVWDNVEKRIRAGHDIDVDMAYVHCMMDTQGYKLTLRVYNTYCFSKATIAAGTRLNSTLYVHCLYSFYKDYLILTKLHCFGWGWVAGWGWEEVPATKGHKEMKDYNKGYGQRGDYVTSWSVVTE
jgi:hypothetical protein